MLKCPARRRSTFPDVRSKRRAMQRARVDLPHPVSPTSPSVSPRRTSRLTPSTACTKSLLRRSLPDCTGKLLDHVVHRDQHVVAHDATGSPTTRARTSARSAASWGSQQAERCPGSAVHLGQGWVLDPAAVHDVGAAGMERATRRQVDQAGRLPGDGLEPNPLRAVRRAASAAGPRCRGGDSW